MAFQNEVWQDFYEKAWAFRAKFMRDVIKKNPGINAYQVIHELAKMQRLNVLEVTAEGKVQLVPVEIEQGNSLSFANISILRHTSSCGHYIVVPYHSGYSYADFLIDIFEAGKSEGGYDCIIELGCGYGRNLFEIFYRGGPRDLPYFGGEFTKSGVKISSDLAKVAPGMQASFFHFNHLKPNLDNIKKLGFKRVLVFTCHSIEQVAQISDEWCDVVASIAPFVRCIHLEPYGYQARDLGETSQNHFKFMREKGWNENLFDVIESAQKRGVIRLEDTVLEIGCGDPMNPGSLACWVKA